jgi:4,5-DOPA dioxygenase extradiol
MQSETKSALINPTESRNIVGNSMANKPEILFLSHGGGPMPLLGDQRHEEMVECLRKITNGIRKPSAILVISAHWEEDVATVTAGDNPPLVYDYYGFPEEAYFIPYPCPGEPALARQVYELLSNAGISSQMDQQRGFDHGLFVPLKVMFPDADIPCIQLSLLRSLAPADHLKIGSALHDLEYKDLLVIGSGFSFHNMREFFAAETTESRKKNESFEAWLIETCASPDMHEQERQQRLSQWENAPAARFCHPREEHLLPLHVCYGIAQRACKKYYELKILNKKSSMYLW